MASSSGKKLSCRVVLLDDSIKIHLLQRKALGFELYSHVFSELKLIETDYFGLEYINKSNNPEWVDKDKLILSQASSTNGRDFNFKLKVKFYTSEPTLLEHDLTRYYFALQIKQDLASGRLVCNESTAAILSSYIVQSELGDFYYQANEHDYLKSMKLVAHQTDEIEDKIAEYHKALRGLSVAEAEFQLLDVVRKTEMYGVVTQVCLNSENVSTNLAVTHSGIHCIYNGVKSTSYLWVRIRKLGFKRKRFLIKLYPNKDNAKTESVAEFTFQTRDAAKAFWKLSVEHHSFFRKLEIKPIRRARHALLSRGSSFRYSGRTQTQLVEQMKQKWGQSTFDRSMSLRNFPTTSMNRLGKSATFQGGQELGVMTLDRPRNTKLTVPSISQVTLESRYSGSYETSPQQNTAGNSPLTVSHSLSAIASLSTSSGRFDLKSSSTFLPKQDGERDSNRDSIAVVEDNRVELERLVEQINSDLTSAQRAKLANSTSEGTDVRTDITSDIERFLSSTSEPLQTPTHQIQEPSQRPETLLVTADVTKPLEEDDDKTPVNHYAPNSHLACNISDDETLEILLTENIKTTPITNLDFNIANGYSVGVCKQPSIPEIDYNNLTVNEVLDQFGPPADATLKLSLGENHKLEQQKTRGVIEDVPKQADTIPADVVILSSPDSGDEDLVFRSGLEISIPPSVRKSRTRSKQEEMDDLQGLSQLAEQVLTRDDHVTRRSQELSDLASQVLDFCTDVNSDDQAQLSDLSELLAHYDAIKRQQQRINQRSVQHQPAQTVNGDRQRPLSPEPNINGHSTQPGDKISVQPPSERTKRKPLIRPALPVLTAPKERLFGWNGDSYKSHSEPTFRSGLLIKDRNTMADSGIVVSHQIKPTHASITSDVSGAQSQQSSSDGYSSDNEDLSETLSSPHVICNPSAR